jgi:hypothetical protein
MMTKGGVVPKYVVVARIVSKPANAVSGSGIPITERVPDTWHLAEVGDDGRLGAVHACGAWTAQDEVRHPVREWKVLGPWCPDCEARAGEAARQQAAHEDEGAYIRL